MFVLHSLCFVFMLSEGHVHIWKHTVWHLVKYHPNRLSLGLLRLDLDILTSRRDKFYTKCGVNKHGSSHSLWQERQQFSLDLCAPMYEIDGISHSQNCTSV